MSKKKPGIRLPESAADEGRNIDFKADKIIINPYHGKEKLTRAEAIDLINHISGALVADGCYRS